MLNRMKFAGRLALLLAVTAALMALVGVTALSGGTRLAASAQAIQTDRVAAMGELARILDQVHHIRSNVVFIVQSESRLTLERLGAEIRQGEEMAAALWAGYRQRPHAPEEEEQARQFETALATWRAAYGETLRMMAAGDSFGARENLGEADGATYRETAAVLRRLTDLQIELAAGHFGKALEGWDTARALALAFILGGLGLLAAVSTLIGRSITRPIAEAIAIMGRLAGGDTGVVVTGTDRSDEIGDIARAVATFKDNAIEREQLRQEQVAAAHRASEERREARVRMAEAFDAGVRDELLAVTGGAGRMAAAARTLSDSSAQAKADAHAVDEAARDASTNAARISAATEALSESIARIAGQVAESSRIAAEAAEESRRTNAIIGDLSGVAGRIGEVVTLISAIARQTNLLALNATIEAARAGDAGKGFAVVAHEVKGLADQTAKATGEIAAQIAEVQTETARAVQAIGNVGDTVQRLNAIAEEVAEAVRQQDASAGEIARSVEQAAEGTRSVSRGVEGLAQAATQSGTASSEVLDTAESLAANAERLRNTVDAFVAQMRNPDFLKAQALSL